MNLAPGRRLLAATLTALCLLPAHLALATISIPSNGGDGSLNITANTVIDLSDPNIVTTAAWDAATPGIAAYDSTKWAVVFHYTDVTIAAGATLSFINHPKNPPVVWLVSGSVTINGTLNLKGKDGVTFADETSGGPGGFRGGRGSIVGTGYGEGFGPGAYIAGAFGTTTQYSGSTYGTPELIPIIGGSGGRASNSTLSQNGGGGGGAILIAAAGDVTMSGTIDVSGGAGLGGEAAGGSGGAIRIVAERLVGSSAAKLRSIGGGGRWPGGAGRICVNVGDAAGFLGSSDPAYAAPTLQPQPQIWPDSTHPSARITEVGSVAIGADPGASLVYPHQDAFVNATGSVVVRIETMNVPQTATVTLNVVKGRGSHIIPAVVAAFQSGTTALAYWTATIPSASLTNGSYAIQARAVLPQ